VAEPANLRHSRCGARRGPLGHRRARPRLAAERRCRRHRRLHRSRHLDERLALDQPVTIHLTGCPHSCAQHGIADIGLLGTKIGEEAVEGYAIYVGGGAGVERAMGRAIYPAVPMAEMPLRVEGLLRAYLAHRQGGESFHDFAAGRSVETLQRLAEALP
jgi:ferredoxin-nitrite reductase